jgi:hypothetical protein
MTTKITEREEAESYEARKPKYMDLAEFKTAGYLQEVNRQFFHPLGLALGIEVARGEGVPEGAETIYCFIYDSRDDPEGFTFAEITEEDVMRGKVIEVEQANRLAYRHGSIGFGLQPLEITERK